MDDVGLGSLLRQLLNALDADVQAIYDVLGEDFRPRYFAVVRRVLEGGEAGISELAASVGVSQPAMTQTVREMIDGGLVEFRPHDDARKRLVALTPSGRATAARLESVWRAVARAAATLDAELPTPLAAELQATMAALRAKSFRQRIMEELKT